MIRATGCAELQRSLPVRVKACTSARNEVVEYHCNIASKGLIFRYVSERLKTGLLPDHSRRLIMKTVMHSSRSDDSYSRAHPHHTLFSLVVSFVLAVLAVLIFTVSAK